jgi:hypothetical protein
MANYFRPRAEDEDIRDRANTSLDAGQAQVDQQADPAADPEADTSLQTRAAQYNLNEGKRQAYETKVRAADARRRNRPGSEAWQNVANAGGGREAAQKAQEARRDEAVTADASTRLAQNDISRQREEQQLAAAQKREQDQQNAADLRKFEAAGGETQVDPATGQKAPAFHPDGAPRFKPGAIEGEKPRQQPTADAALASVPGMGAVMTLGGPIDQTTELVQPMRNDRGGIADVPLEQKTDPKTGEIYSETKDQFGQTQRVSLGQDTKIPRLNQIQTEIDTRAMELQALDVQRAQLEPAWKPVEENYKKAKTALDAPLEFIQENGKWVENTPQRFPADPEKLAKWRQSRESTLQWYNNAAKSYGQQAPAMDNLQKQQQEIKLRHEQAQLTKKRVELDLPEQDGGIAATLTAAETGQLPSEEASTADYLKTLATGMPGFGDAFLTANGQASYQQLPALPDGIDLPKTRPIIPQDDPGKAAMISKAFNGVAAPDQLMLHDDGDGFTRVVRKDPNPKGTNHNSIGNMEIDKATGIPRMVLDPRWAPTDILSQVTFGNTDGIDIYLREPKNFTFSPAKEAEWAASIFDAISRNPDPKANNEIIESMGAGPEQILAKLKGGELSVKRAEALMQNLWGSTLKAEDPSAPGAFDKWLYQQTSKQNRDAWTAATVSRSTSDKNAVLQTYMDEWQSRNAWKPGVTLQQRVDFEKKLKLTPRTTEQIADLADSFATTAIQSVAMLSQLSAPVIVPVNAVLNPGDNTKWAEAVGRATANDTRMLGRTATRYATEEGKQAFAERDTIAELIRNTVMTQDVHTGGRESPEWKAAMDAAIRQATDNADKIHGWNREDGWEITREDLDPATNAHLRKLIDIYALTGNKDYLDSFMAAQLEDHGTRQTAKYQLDLAAGRNKYVAAWFQGTHASLYETATEVASTAATLGTGKVLFGVGKALTASKAAAHMVKLEKAAEAGSRLAKFRLAMHGIKADVLKAGMVPDTLANPATRLGKLGNAASKVGKFAVATGATGALEEGFMGLARPDASVPNILHDAMIGAIMEPLLGGIMSVPTVAIGSAIQQSKVSRNVAKFSDAYNREFNSSEGFVPITPQKAQAAMALFDGVNLNAFAQRLTESAANVKIAVEAAAADTAGPAEIQAMHAAQAAHREVIDSVSESIFSRLEAVQHVDSVQAEDRPLAYAIAKVAAGRADLVTPQERAAAAGALTPQGSPVFATAANGIDILTDEGRAHAMSRFPGVGMLIQTAESERMFQEQMAAEPTAATGQSDPNVTPAAAPDNVADTANIPRVAITPEQQQQAAQVTAQVIAQITAEAPAIAARLSRGAATVRVSGGVTASVGADGMPRIQIIEDDIAQSLAAGMTPAQVAARVKDNIVLHETIHTLQFQVAEQQQTAAGVTGDPATLSQDFYRGIHATMAAESPQMLENGRALYAENDDGSAPAWDTLPEWAQAAEVVRMLTEAKLAGRTTDISRLMEGASPSLLAKLAQIVKDMITAITTGENIPESVKQHVDTLTELYNQLLNDTPSPANTRSTNPGSNPSQSTPGQTAPGAGAAPQANSNRQPANNGGTQPPPSDNAGAPPQSADPQDRVKATEIVRKEFDKALASRPLLKKDADLMTGLREAAIDIVNSHIGRPAAEIADAAARAIGTYLQSPEVSEKLGQLYAAQSDKAKAYRAAAAARVNAEAARVIAQRMATVRDLIESIGRITRPTNALELYRTGQTLPPEWNGMLRSSDYAGGGKNAVVRAILGMIYAPDENSGSSPDSIAVGLEREFPDKYQGMTPDMLWTALQDEIRGYLNGADTSNLDDPDADTSGMSDDQIQALADRHAKAAVVEKWRGITGKPTLPANAEAYEAEYQSIVAAEGENDFLDEEYQQQAIAAVDARLEAEAEARRPKPKIETREQLNAVETGGSQAPLNPRVEGLEGQSVTRGDFSGKTQPLSTAALKAIQRNGAGVTTLHADDTLKRAVEAFVSKAQATMPLFQGNKIKMAKYVASAILRYWSKAQRESVTTFYDLFAGGGAWGLVLADTFFPNVKKFVINEFDTPRSIKVEQQMVNGHKFAEVIQKDDTQKIIKGILQDYYARGKGVSWGGIYVQFEKWSDQNAGKFDDTTVAIIKMLADDSTLSAPASWGNLQEEIGKELDGRPVIQKRGPNAEELTKWFLERHAPLAETIHQTYQRMVDRGVTFTFRNGDAYTMNVESGKHVFVTADPPYFATTGYDDSIVGPGMYAATRNLMRRLTGQDNNVAYTDEAWWVKDSINDVISDADLVEGAEIATQIANTLDFMVVAGKIESRYETLGLHNPAGSPVAPGRTANTNGNESRPDGGNLQQEGRGPDGRGGAADVAPGTLGQAGLQPPGDARLGSAPVQADRRPNESGKDYYQRITQAPVVRFEDSRIVHHTTGEKAAEAIAAGQFQTGADLGVAEKRGAVYFADEDVNPGIYARNDEGGSYEGQQARTLPIDIRGLALLNNEYAPDQGYPNHQQYGNNRIRGEFDTLPPGVDGYISFLDDGRIYEVALPAATANQAREQNRLFSAPAQRMGIFDRWRKPAEPDQQEPATPPAAVEQPARKQLRGVNLKRMVSTLGESMYAKNLWHTIGKEVFQNAVDAVKLNGEGGAISYTEKSSEFTMADNGPGMLPNHILDKFLPAFESGKGVGEGGGFGMAKLAFLGGPKQWEMVTRAKTPDGRILQTTLKGSGESYLNFVTDPHEVETGTLEEITLADGLTMKSEYFSEGVSEGMKTGTALRFTGEGYAYPAGRFIAEAMQFVPEVSVSKGEIGEPLGKMIQATGTGTSASNHSWGLVHSIDLPEATVEIIAREGSEQAVSKYLHLPFLNRSILQFSFGISLGESVLLPKDIAINIKPKVEAGTVDYPFATNRESVTDNVSNAVKDYLRSIGTQAASEMNDRYAKAKDNSPKIAGTRIAMFDAGGKVPSDVMAEIANAPETKEIAMDVQRIQEAIIKTLARKHGPAYGRATFAGLMTGGHAYGVHFGSSTGPSQIYHDAWLTYDLARKEAEALIIEDGGDLMSDTLENQQIIYDAFLAKTAGIALHEALHQEIRSEGEELARGLTFNAGDIVDTVVTLIKTDRSNEHTARLTAHLFLTGQQLQTFENKDEADRVFRSQGGYQGYQLGKQAGDGKRTEKDRGDRTAVSPRDEVREFGGQPLHARLREATAEFKRAFTPLDPKNPFGEWSASTTEPGILIGYRGENGNGQADNNFGSSEGVGLYLARDEKDTSFFGKARRVNFPKPKNPLVVDQDGKGDNIPMLEEGNDEIWDHIWSHKPDPQDSDWVKAHVLAAKQLGMTRENSEGWDTKLPRALTDELLAMGHDAVYVRSGGMEWVVLLAKQGERFNRNTRSAGGSSLFSAPQDAAKTPWSGVVDLRDGHVEKTFTYKQAEDADFHHSFLVSPSQASRINNGEADYFWIENGKPTSMRGLPPAIVASIKKSLGGKVALYSAPQATPQDQYAHKFLTDKLAKTGSLTPQEHQKLIAAEKAIGQAHAFDLDDPALKSRSKGSVSPSFQPQFNLQRQHPVTGQQLALFSAPAQPVDDASALDAALKGMDPIYLKVFQASQRTPTPTPQDLASEFRLPERAIANIIGTARTRIMAHGRTIRPGGLTPATTADGRLKGGMPQRANSTTPILAAVDQIQQQEGLPLGKTANEIHTAGYAILQRPDATQHLLDAHLNGIPNEGQIFAAAQLLLEAGIKGEQSPALTELALLYRQRGTEQSDAFRARIDIHRTPAERNALIFQELFTSPNKQVQKAWREAKTPEQKAAILQEWNARVKGVKEALKARGLDLQDAMDRLASQRTDAKAAESEASAAHQKLVDALQADVARLKAQLAAATDEAAKSTAQTQVDAAQEKADQAATLDPTNTIRLELQKLNKMERLAIEDLRDGGTWESAAYFSLLSVPEVKRVFDKFADALDDAGARAILLAEDILLDNQARLNSPAANAMSRQDRAREGAAAIRKALGYDRNLIDRRSKGIAPKPKKGGTKKPAADRPEPADMTDEQFQAYLDNPQTWRSLWQAEVIVTGEETSFDQWINKPETRARKTRLTRMSQAPVSTTTGELDMHDPMSVKRAFDEFNIHNASLFDKAVAIWRMGILSGLHTGIVNFGGNVAHSQYNLWPRRLMEAGVNNVLSAIGLGSKEAATFGELKYMAQAQHKAMARAGTAMALSWNMDTRIVESEVLALGTQLEFSGIGADYIPKAVGGPLGKLLHAISFRHMTAADEMIKAYHSQTEVMAQAYRMAKAEKLTGAAFDKRMDELLEYGSQAWRKAMDSATWVTFQNEVDPTNPRSLAIFDRAAAGLRRLAHTDTGKTKEIINGKGQKVTVPIMKPNVFAFFFPFISTPLNIMKIGIEMSPVGAFFSTVDALRALKIRIENKSISPEQSRIEASELYNRLRLVQDLTNQIIGMGMFYALGSLVKPDDDEELPWITGSTDWKSTSKGDRDLRARVMPAYTLRVPFTDAMLTYQRIEPFGTALGFIIDARIAVNRKGWSDEALGEFMATAINQFNDKTYMKGLSDLMAVWNDPERIGTRLTSSIVTGFVPNLIRQPIREADPYMRDTKPGADVGFVEGVWHNIKYSLAPGYAPIAQDVWGNPIKRHPGQQFGNVHTDVLLRVFDPTNLTVRDQIDPLDLYLFNWNNTAATPKERFNIEPIQKNLQITRGGKTTTVQLTPEDHAAANRNAGQAARQFLGNDWDASNPQPQQVERVKEVLQKFQKRERDRLRDKYRSALPEE